MLTPRSTHLSEREVAGFIDDGLAPDARAIAEAHLADCAACREEVVAAARLVDVIPAMPKAKPSRRISAWRMGAVAAAAIVVLSVLPLVRARETPAGSNQRSTRDETARLTLLGPADAAPVPRPALRLVWHADVANTSYHIIVTDDAGGTVWTTTTTDTTVSIPADVRLPAGTLYYWYVDARRPDGWAVTSDFRRFSVAP